MERKRLVRMVLIVAILGVLGWIAWNKWGPQADTAGDPRLVLGRIWFDRLPKSRTEDVTVGIWFGGGIGLYDTGSAWRSTIDIFEFERRGDALDMTFLHDKKKSSVKFKITRCDEKPPFDLCLDLDNPPRGPKRLYGFSREDEGASKVPWSRDLFRAHQTRANMSR
jgi:hypothetical protein